MRTGYLRCVKSYRDKGVLAAVTSKMSNQRLSHKRNATCQASIAFAQGSHWSNISTVALIYYVSSFGISSIKATWVSACRKSSGNSLPRFSARRNIPRAAFGLK